MIIIFLIAFGMYFGPVSCMEKNEPLFQRFYANDVSEEENNYHETRLFNAENAAYRCDMTQLIALVSSQNVNAVNQEKHPVLFSVLNRGFDDLAAPIKEPIEFLTDLGANIDEYSYNQEMSALEYATRRALVSKKTITPLIHILELGANPFSKNPGKSSSPYQLAYKRRNKSARAEEIIALFRSHIKTLHQAVCAHDIQKVSYFVSKDGATTKDYRGKTPLYYAITRYTHTNKSEMLPILQILLNNHANPNEIIGETCSPQTSHLLLATIVSLVQADLSMISHLLKSGGNPFERTATTPSAYDFAIFTYTLPKSIATRLIKLQEEDDQPLFKKIIARIEQNQYCALELIALFNAKRLN